MDNDNGLTYNLTCCLDYIMDHDNGITYNSTYCLGYIMDHDKVLPTIWHIVWVTLWIMKRSYLQFNILFGLHYGPWPRSYLQFNILFGIHYGSWQDVIYNLTCCLGYIMDHDKVLPTIWHIVWDTLWIITRSYLQFSILFVFIMDHDNGLICNLTYCLGYIMDHEKVLPPI